MGILWLAQVTPGADAGSLWGLAGVIVVVGGGIVTTLLIQRRRASHVEDPVAEALKSIITDLRHELTAQQERCDREIAEIRERHDKELARLRGLIKRLEDRQLNRE